MKKLTKYVPLTVIALVVVVAVGMTVSAFSGIGNPTTVIEHADVVNVEAPEAAEESLGYGSRNLIFGDFKVQGALTSGLGVLEMATSTGTTVLTASQLLDNSFFDITVNDGTTASITLPATSTLKDVLDPGATRKWMIHNATSSTMAMTIVTGTGIDLIGVTANDDVIDATEYSELECMRKADQDWFCRISELVHVD